MPFASPQVEAVFNAYPEPLKSRLTSLRRLILETAATAGVGELEETLKWGQPSYLTSASGSGSTIRIDRTGAATPQYAMYFNCQTDLVPTFRELYPELTYSGNRAILFGANEELPVESIRHCISLALTYHRRKRAPARAQRFALSEPVRGGP
jgi:hypothetical protein